ncbi:MAG: PKD domain-containing protein, partial [Flavobacteriales bacterium]|nr:PKD domain-containing protein [Flavobacteriales bacterium]
MKKLLSILLVFICIYSINAQTASIMDGCVPLTVNFVAPAGATSSYWDFKDGATSNLLNPSNTFTGAKSYVVEYRAVQNGPIINTIIINVAPKPVPMFVSDTTMGCAPLTVNFDDITTVDPAFTVTSYSWVFEDGGTAIGKNISHTFSTPGSFFVSLEINTNSPSCDVTRQFNNYITTSDKPTVSFTTNPNPPVACISPLNVAFTNTSSSAAGGLSYSWDLGNGNTSSSTNPPNQTYTVSQAYQVKLVAIDTNGCSDSSIRTVSIGTPEPLLQFKDTLCIDEKDTIFNNSSGAATWGFNQLGLEIHGNYKGLHPMISFETGGTKTIDLRLSAGGCFKDTTLTIFVHEVIADFVSSPSYSCSYPANINFTSTSTTEPNSTYRWVFDDATNATGITATKDYINVPDTSPYHINVEEYYRTTLLVTNSFGCTDVISKSDTVHAPTALMLPSVVRGCVPLDVTFSDSSLVSLYKSLAKWEWFFGDGTSVTRLNRDPTTHTYNSTGKYFAYLVVTTLDGCTDTSYLTKIQVGEPITPNFVADKLVICIGDTVDFTDQTVSLIADSIDTWNYSTEGSRLFSCADNNNPSWVYNNEVGLQDVTMTIGFNGCYTSFTRQGYIEVKGAVAEIDYLKYCDQDFLVDFKDSSQNSNNTLWQFGDGTTDITSNPSHTYPSTGDYTVTLRAEDQGSGCQATFDTAQIYIRNLTARFQVDSIFDTTICAGTGVIFDASQSNDVYEYCHRGYRWVTSDPFMRPYTTDSDTVFNQFITPGPTTVQLFTTDINGCIDTASKTVRVYDITANFGIDDLDVCPGQQLTFTDSSFADTTISRWYWNFGDSSILNTQSFTRSYDTLPELNYPFPNPTQRTEVISLSVFDTLGCGASKNIRITFYEPKSIITVSDSTICSGSTVNFSASDFTEKGSNLTFDWDLKNGSTSGLQNPTSTYSVAGNYLVELEIEEVATGCKNDITQNIEVIDYPIAGFSTSADGQKY